MVCIKNIQDLKKKNKLIKEDSLNNYKNVQSSGYGVIPVETNKSRYGALLHQGSVGSQMTESTKFNKHFLNNSLDPANESIV